MPNLNYATFPDIPWTVPLFPVWKRGKKHQEKYTTMPKPTYNGNTLHPSRPYSEKRRKKSCCPYLCNADPLCMGGGGEILLTSSGGGGQETSDDDTPVLLPPFFPQCHQLHDRLCPVPSYFRPFPPFTQKRRRGPRGVPKATGGWFGGDAQPLDSLFTCGVVK